MKDKKNKPLRATVNKIKDLREAYIKDKGEKTIPISSPDDSIEKEEINGALEELDENKVLDEKIDIQDDIKSEITDENDELLQKINSLEIAKVELSEQVLRKTAELDNMRRRFLKEKNELIEFANKRLFNNLLPILDDFSTAIESGKNSNDYDSLLKGIEMIYQKAEKIFEEAGVKKMHDLIGKPFDVDSHEAVMLMPSDDIQEGNIVQVALPGYMFHDQVLRHAKVVTSAGKTENKK